MLRFNGNNRCIFIVFFWVISIIIFPLNIYADNVTSQSGNYKIEGLTVGAQTSDSSNQSGKNRGQFYIVNNFKSERLQSKNYSIGIGSSFVYMANVPLIRCFETVTDFLKGYPTSCSDTIVNSYEGDPPPGKTEGMVNICGKNGCFDKARFEIDTQNNPSDTLYSVQISTDPEFNTYQYIDGSTFTVEDIAYHDLNDYLTVDEWNRTNETDPNAKINVFGLNSGMTYYLRVSALNGDFTESGFSPVKNATTSYPTISYDIDIAPAQYSYSGEESNSPYSISLGVLSGDQVITADNGIWMDISTNLPQGIGIFVKDENKGLRSSSTGSVINSDFTTMDLDNNDGFGANSFYNSELILGPLTASSGNYNNNGNIVGGFDNVVSRLVYTSSGNPIYDGRCGLLLRVRSNIFNLSTANDYTDRLTFTVLASL